MRAAPANQSTRRRPHDGFSEFNVSLAAAAGELMRYAEGGRDQMAASVWEYAKASDRLLGEDPAAFSDRVSELKQVPEGSVFLRNDQQRLELWWHDELAVIGHCDSEEKDLDCAVTEKSLKKAEAAPDDMLEWTCSCCGVTLGRFKFELHIRRDAALEIVKHVLSQNTRPDSGIDGPIIWTTVDAD